MRSARLINEIGKRHGKLIVVGGPNTDKYGAATWVCRCDCGTLKDVSGTAMRKGSVQSCGCLKKIHSLKYWNGKQHNPLDRVDDDLLY